jgi:hypothetical protein
LELFLICDVSWIKHNKVAAAFRKQKERGARPAMEPEWSGEHERTPVPTGLDPVRRQSPVKGFQRKPDPEALSLKKKKEELYVKKLGSGQTGKRSKVRVLRCKILAIFKRAFM